MIYFLHPNKKGNIGGIESIIYELLKFGSSNDRLLGMIDYCESPLVERLRTEGINFEFIPISVQYSIQLKTTFGKDDVVIIFNNSVKVIPFRLNSDVKVLVWDVYYPYWKLGYMRLFNKSAAKKLFNIMLQKGGLITMDEHLYDVVKCKFNLEIPIAPPPISKLKYANGDSFHRNKVCYVGRCEEWKNIPLAKFIMDCNYYKLDDVEIDVYTDNSKGMQQELEGIIGSDFNNVKVNYIEGLYGDELYKQISGYNFGIAMGMSALLLANLKVPTLLLDAASRMSLLLNYKYRWLGESDRFFDVGTSIDDSISNLFLGDELQQKVEELSNSRDLVINLNQEVVKRFQTEALFSALHIYCSETKLKSSDFSLLFTGFIGGINYFMLRTKRFLFSNSYHW
ncbi:hypothetical protein EEY24_10020 [Shewanella algae]|nr:hypothetical protein EEY24_10020 [Shewanella algae]